MPDLVGEADRESVLRQRLPAIDRMTELGSLRKLPGMPEIQTPEALYLGMRPSEAQMAQGPLTVAALGADPPERSTHFHLSLMSFTDDRVAEPRVVPSGEEEREIVAAMRKLDTRTLTTLAGEGLDHALVWEGVGDLETQAPAGAAAHELREVLPQGDAEPSLRRFIDDSINILTDLELNQRRVEEGLPILNALWPWGEGRRVAVPNLALRRGEPALVESESLRLAGLARLAGYKHGDRHWLRHGINLDLERLAGHARGVPVLIALISAPEELRRSEHFEELEWFVERLDSKLIAPLLEATLEGPRRLILLAPRVKGVGLALTFEHGQTGSNSIPFDERALEEKSVANIDISNAVVGAIAA